MEERLPQHHFDVHDEKNVDLIIELYSKDVYKVAYFYVKDKGRQKILPKKFFTPVLKNLKIFEGNFRR